MTVHMLAKRSLGSYQNKLKRFTVNDLECVRIFSVLDFIYRHAMATADRWVRDYQHRPSL